MSGDGIQPGNRLWTPWRMAYVAGPAKSAECVFCAAAAGDDDVASLVVHRGEHVFVIMNLFPYNTGHLMVVPYDHANHLAAISAAARSELFELTAAFTSELQEVMGCEGINLGMNLGSAAGAGIADHLHQHVVPRWIGDSNFMPLVGGTKVLPELLPATYGKLRAELVRQQTGATEAQVVLISPSGRSVYLDRGNLLRVSLREGEPVWRAVVRCLRSEAASLSLRGWAGLHDVRQSAGEPVLAYEFTPSPEAHYSEVLISRLPTDSLTDEETQAIESAVRRFT
jgi:ATP adenylyltransferase